MCIPSEVVVLYSLTKNFRFVYLSFGKRKELDIKEIGISWIDISELMKEKFGINKRKIVTEREQIWARR